MRGSVVVVFALLALAPAAHADVTIGSPLTADPGAPLAGPVTISPAGVTAPAGIVTRWRIRAGAEATPVHFVVIRANRVEQRSATVTPRPSDTSVFETRLPIAAGDSIGIECCDPPGGAYFAPTAGATASVWDPPLADGETRDPAPTEPVEVLVQASIEVDGDDDGFGDETQDDCPSEPGVAPDGCPAATTPPPPPAAPRVNRPPTVRFRTPLAGSVIGPAQTIELEVSDDAGNPTVTLFDDDGTICTLSGPPYSCTWRPTGADVGRATLLASAVDSDGRSTLGIVRVRVSRFAANLTVRRRGRRVSGRLRLPAAVPRSLGCRGDVTVRRKRVRRTVALKRNCRYSVRLPRGRGKPRARFAGNAVVAPAT